MNFHCFNKGRKERQREFMLASLNGNQLFFLVYVLWSGLLSFLSTAAQSFVVFFVTLNFADELLKNRVEGTGGHDSLI